MYDNWTIFRICRFLLLCSLLPFSSYAYSSKVYKIKNNGIPFDIQLFEILSNIDNLKGSCSATIKIEGGYYSISKTINITGGRHKIIIEGDKNKPTIISGSKDVEGWSVLKNGIWRSQTVFNEYYRSIPDQLFVNGVRATRSRIPKEGSFTIKNSIKDNEVNGVILGVDEGKKLDFIGEYEIPIISLFRRWAVAKRYIDEKGLRDSVLYIKGKDFPSHNGLKKGNKIVLENTKNGIDMPGEWCVDNRGFVYYLPLVGETIKETSFRIPVVEQLIHIIGKGSKSSGIVLKNIIFEHSTTPIPQEGFNYGQAAAPMSAAIEIEDINNTSFENCEIRNVSNYGIWIKHACSYSSIKNCYFHDIGAGAIKIGMMEQQKNDIITRHIIAENNLIERYGTMMESAVGIILFNAADCIIRHNDIHDGNYTAISLGWKWGYGFSPSKRNEVSYNRILRIGSGLLCDLGGIYTLGESEGTRIHHNYISEVRSYNSDGWGLYLDEGTTGVVVEKNIIYRCTGSFHQHFGSDNLIKNNIFAYGYTSQITLSKIKEKHPFSFINNIVIMDSGSLMTGDGILSHKYIIDKNCYWNESINSQNTSQSKEWVKNKDKNAVFMNPLFVNPHNGDFRMKDNSVCKAISFKKFDCLQSGVSGAISFFNKSIN